MIKIEHIVTASPEQMEFIIEGMRNPMNSWEKSDSYAGHEWFGNGNEYFHLGENDRSLMQRLSNAGTDDRKFMRMMPVYMRITAPLYWWKEFDTYKVGTVANSCSTMHRLTHKPFEVSDFSFEHLIGNTKKEYFDVDETFDEIFTPIAGHSMYEISNKGRVYSKKRDKFLRPSVNSSNYKKVVLNGKNLYVHRLVAEAFCENPKGSCEVNHKDGNKWNNNYTNLEWVTKSENAQHAFDAGLRTISGYTRYKVSKSAHRFTDYEIEQIRQMYYDGMTKKEIADKIGCYSSTICDILNGNTYREIDMTSYDTAKLLLDALNELREKYLKTKDKYYWWQMIQLLPSSYNQTRNVMLNYEVLANIYKSRKTHKLDEWREFCRWIETLPYSELITGDR